MASQENRYDPQKAVTITMTAEQWQQAFCFIQGAMDSHHAQVWSWKGLVNAEQELRLKKQREHEDAAQVAENLCSIIEAALYH